MSCHKNCRCRGGFLFNFYEKIANFNASSVFSLKTFLYQRNKLIAIAMPIIKPPIGIIAVSTYNAGLFEET